MPGENSKNILMGIDGGTGSIRVGLYDFTGKCLSFASENYPTVHAHPGWAEQAPDDWWSGLRSAVVETLKKADITADRIAAIAAIIAIFIIPVLLIPLTVSIKRRYKILTSVIYF